MTKKYTRGELYELVWARPVTRVAEDLGISDVALHKICRKHAIPVPGRGHWAKLAAGKSVVKASLSEKVNPLMDQVLIRGSIAQRFSASVLQSRERARLQNAEPARFDVAPLADTPCPYIGRLKEKAQSVKPQKDGFVHLTSKRQFAICVTPSCLERAVLTLERLTDAARELGHSVRPGNSSLELHIDDESISLSIVEISKRVPHEPTKSEKAKIARWQSVHDRRIRLGQWSSPWDKPEIPEFDDVPSGQLVVEIDQAPHYDGLRRRFSDGKRQRVENLTQQIVAAAETCAIAAVERRLAAERRRLESEEREKRRLEFERQRILEEKRWEFLEGRLRHVEKAQRLERFVSDYEATFSIDALPGSCRALLRWASKQAAMIRSEISPENLATTLDKYQLMDDSTNINSWVRFDDRSPY